MFPNLFSLKFFTNKNNCFLLIFLLILSGCATNSIYKSQTSLPIPLSSKILVLPPEVLFSKSQTLSDPEPHLEETIELADILDDLLMEFMFDRGVEYVPYKSKTISDEHIPLVQQAEVIIDATQSKRSSQNRFYALSQDSINLLKNYDADYVLLSDYGLIKPTSEAVLVSLLVGYVNRDTWESYSMSLFDLRDGQLVWYNYQPSVSIGAASGLKSRTKEWRLKTLNKIMSDFPH